MALPRTPELCLRATEPPYAKAKGSERGNEREPELRARAAGREQACCRARQRAGSRRGRATPETRAASAAAPSPCVSDLPVSERHDPTGEPVAGKPHDGFGERGAETWQGERLRHRHDAKAAGKPLLPHAKASASLPDSTPVLDFGAVDQFRMDLGSGDMALDSGSEQRLGQDRRSAVNCARFAALPSLGTQCSRRPPKGRDKISGARTANSAEAGSGGGPAPARRGPLPGSPHRTTGVRLVR